MRESSGVGETVASCDAGIDHSKQARESGSKGRTGGLIK